MSDFVLSLIPADLHWQPTREAADRTVALVHALTSDTADDADHGDVEIEIDIDWYDTVTVVDCGENLERIDCPHCGGTIDREWWGDLLETRDSGDSAPDLSARVPCCDTDTTLDALGYDWPVGFSRFEIAIWNPDPHEFTPAQLTALGEALGHPVRQILAHI